MQEVNHSGEILVTAIVSTYNSELFLEGRLENLFKQTVRNVLELVIINSGSEQNEGEIVKKFIGKGIPIQYLRTENRETIYKAWNRAIKMSRGKFITNANTDDRLREDTLEILSTYLTNNPDVGMVYADQYISSIPNQKFEDSRGGEVCRFPDFSRIYSFERCIVGSQPMWRSDIHFKENIWFDESLEVSGDHEFQLKISQNYRIHHIRKILGSFYKSSAKTNKEYEDPERNFREVSSFTEKYIHSYLKTLNNEQLKKILREFKFRLFIPLRLFLALRMIDKSFNSIYPKFFFNSVEFTYYFTALIYERIGRLRKASKICQKYLGYKYSHRISVLLSQLKKSEGVMWKK